MNVRFLTGPFLLVAVAMNGMYDDKLDEKMSTLEQTLATLTTPEGAPVSWLSAADCLIISNDLLNTYFDYQGTVVWTEHAIQVCEYLIAQGDSNDLVNSLAARAYLGIAWAYHNTGKNDLRDTYLAKAQHFLNIPDDVHDYHEASYVSEASDYLIAEGYRNYICYEQAERKKEPVDVQEKHLWNGEYSFKTALVIIDKFNKGLLDQSHAMHGLGTTYEFLGKCQQIRRNKEGFIEFLKKSVAASAMRETVLGPLYPHVARSLHKLARNYCLLGEAGDESNKPNYIIHAGECFLKSIAIFNDERNKMIPFSHVKRFELSSEYAKFQEKYHFGA